MKKRKWKKYHGRSCETCGGKFETETHEINRGKGRFCSATCSNRWKAKTFLARPGGWKLRKNLRRQADRTKDRAREAVYRALRSGKLKRRACGCGATDVQAHHRDYSKPLEVEWYCRPCHGAADKRDGYR